MVPQRKGAGLMAAFMMAMLMGAGCAGSAPAEHPAPEYVPAEVQLGSEIPTVSEGRIDSQNRYLFTAALSTRFLVPNQGVRERTCSGVLIDPRVVLTAGHCVCGARKSVPPEAAEASFIDRSTCVETTAVTMMRYKVDGEGLRAMIRSGVEALPGERIGPYRGKVYVHEDIRIVYREMETRDGWESSTGYSQADLAIIVLDQPVPDSVEPVRLSEKPVDFNERVVLVGFGTARVALDADDLVRRYGENVVVSIKNDGTTFHIGRPLEVSPGYSGERPELIRRRGSYAESGDSGGPPNGLEVASALLLPRGGWAWRSKEGHVAPLPPFVGAVDTWRGRISHEDPTATVDRDLGFLARRQALTGQRFGRHRRADALLGGAGLRGLLRLRDGGFPQA
jgi:hypothetical protein